MRRRWVRIAVSVVLLAAVFAFPITFWLTWALSMLVVVMVNVGWWAHRLAAADANRMAEWWTDNEGYENPEHDQAREPDL